SPSAGTWASVNPRELPRASEASRLTGGNPMTMTRSTVRHLLLAATLAFSGMALAETIIGSGKAVTENRPVSGFSSIAVGLPGDVRVTQGDTETLSITPDDNVLPQIESVVENGTLKIRFRKEHNFTITRATIKVALA